MKAGRVDPGEWSLYRDLINPWVYDRMEADTAAVFGLAEENKAVGALVLLFFEEGPEIASLYVAPEYRKRGGGSLLLMYAEAVSDEAGWDLAATVSLSDEGQKAVMELLEKRGYEPLSDDHLEYRFTLGEIREHESKEENSKEACFLKDLPEVEKKRIMDYADRNNLPRPEKGLFEDPVDLEVSAVIPGRGGEFSYVIVEKTGENALTVSGVYHGSKDPLRLMKLFHTVIGAAREKYPPETEITVMTMNEKADKLVHYFLPEGKNTLFTWLYTGKRGGSR